MMSQYLSMLRPAQWLKNLMLLFPPFLAGQIHQSSIFTKAVVPVMAFCLVSSAGYILNDIRDRASDFHHPQKRFRPIAAGVVNVPVATCVCAFLLGGGLMLGSSSSFLFFSLLLCYALVSLSYSLFLKSVPVLDLFCIAAGFLLRLEAGGEAFHIPISPWLFLSVFLLAIFLSTGKRLGESFALGDAAGEHRASLALYPPGFLPGTMYMTGAAVLVTYSMYSLNKHTLIYSVPLCLFGLLRYMFQVSSGRGGDPTESLLKDHWLLVVGVMWVFMVVWSIYL